MRGGITKNQKIIFALNLTSIKIFLFQKVDLLTENSKIQKKNQNNGYQGLGEREGRIIVLQVRSVILIE